MFERFTERARRSVFFARYEASQLGSPYIEPEHFFLGILREDKTIASLLPGPGLEQVRHEIEERQEKREKISTSVDLPLSTATKRSLGYAAEEADELAHLHIDGVHLMLGLLRLEPSVVADMLGPHGIGYDSMKATARARQYDTPPKAEPEPAGSAHPLSAFVSEAAKHLEWLREADADQHLKTGTWTRKQAIGHLIDYATAHHQWISRAMVEPRVAAAGYPDGGRGAAQKYEQMSWTRLVRLWTALNHLLGHVILQVPEEKKQTPCRIGVADEVPLDRLIAQYMSYTEGLVAEILMRG
jgi:Clp amino terminal domain, pathogenicity island component